MSEKLKYRVIMTSIVLIQISLGIIGNFSIGNIFNIILCFGLTCYIFIQTKDWY